MPAFLRRVTPESLVAAFIAAFGAVMLCGYLLDAIGIAMHPALLAVAATAAAVVGFVTFGDDPEGGSASALALYLLVTVGAFGYLLWLASPSLLPVTNGPDVVHHLQLIHLIQRTHRLAHDPALGLYLLEMMNYTPGAHIAAAALGDWLRLDSLRIIFPLTAAFVAVKAGIVYLLMLRVLGARPGAAAYALAAPALLTMPSAYALGSFFHFYFFAQVVSETFAMTMALSAVNWVRTEQRRHLWMASVAAVGVFLSWPVWIAAGLASVAAAIVTTPAGMRARAVAMAPVILPVTLIAVLHLSMHAAGASIIGSSGAVTRPSVETIGLAFGVLAMAGFTLAVTDPRARPVAALFAVAILQALMLAAIERRTASRSFYMPFKMVYLAVLPGAVLGGYVTARLGAVVSSLVPSLRLVVPLLPVALIALLAAGRMPTKRQHGSMTEPSLAAGRWARVSLPISCIDYFSNYWLTGYWLHLDVLGNPRLSDRMRAETFEFRDVVGRWIEGRGLPYAIVEDLDAVPRDARVDMVPLQRFGPAAIVQNTRPGSDPEVSLCRVK